MVSYNPFVCPSCKFKIIYDDSASIYKNLERIQIHLLDGHPKKYNNGIRCPLNACNQLQFPKECFCGYPHCYECIILHYLLTEKKE
jgi:hypothetical protein